MKTFGIVFAAIAATCLVGVAFIAGQPPTVGSDGVVAPVAISWVSLILSLFTGSTVASIAAFWKSVQPAVATITKTIAPGMPIPPADITEQLEDASELLQAVLAYSKNGDPASQRRMVLALMTQLTSLSETQSPEIATAVSTAMLAITAKWFPSVEAVDEIRRLRAKVNRLIRVHNEQDAGGNHIGEHYAATEDLILEEEI